MTAGFVDLNEDQLKSKSEKIIDDYIEAGKKLRVLKERLGELAHLRWKDVDFRHNLIHIQNQPGWTTKSYKPRVIPMHPTARQILESGKVVLVLFGTAWGLDSGVMHRADFVLDPIEGNMGYNHLSVRAASAIILDRLLGRYR